MAPTHQKSYKLWSSLILWLTHYHAIKKDKALNHDLFYSIPYKRIIFMSKITLCSSSEPKVQGELLSSASVCRPPTIPRLSSIKPSFKRNLFPNHLSKFRINSQECSPLWPIAQLLKSFRSTEHKSCQS